MNLRRFTTSTGAVLVGALLMTGCSQGPANADSAPRAAVSQAAISKAAVKAQAASVPTVTSGTGTMDDPYVATVQTKITANTAAEEWVYGSNFTNLNTCQPFFPVNGVATLPDGSTQEDPWLLRDKKTYAQYSTLKTSFVADGSKASTKPRCVNGKVTHWWDGYTTEQPVLLKGSYYTLTYAPVAAVSARAIFRNATHGSAMDATFYNKKGKAMRKAFTTPNKSHTWKMKFHVYDYKNKTVTVQKRTVKKVKGKTVRGKWKNFKNYKTNSKGVATFKFTGGGKTWHATIDKCDKDVSAYRVKVPARSGWNATYAGLCASDSGDFS